MKQIIPFKKELLFKTKVSEITSISLEHTLTLKEKDLISGEFHVMGDYKMTEGSINREKFDFQLPFEIALDGEYNKNSILIDIDNFYYEVIDNESLQVNIDVYIEGEKLDKVEDVKEVSFPNLENFIKSEENDISDCLDVRNELECQNKDEEIMPVVEYDKPSKFDKELYEEFENEMVPKVTIAEFNSKVDNSSDKVSEEIEKEVSVNNFQIFENIDNSDTYVTYHVYIVKEDDTIDRIIERYGTTKEELQAYNTLEEIKPGAKIIIPN